MAGRGADAIAHAGGDASLTLCLSLEWDTHRVSNRVSNGTPTVRRLCLERDTHRPPTRWVSLFGRFFAMGVLWRMGVPFEWVLPILLRGWVSPVRVGVPFGMRQAAPGAS